MPKILYSYNTFPDNGFQVSWSVGGRERKDGDAVKSWRKNAGLPFIVRLILNISREDIKKYINPGTQVAFYVTCSSLLSSGGTSLQECVAIKSWNLKNEEIIIDGEIPGDRVAGDIVLTVSLALSASVPAHGLSVYATKKGSVLFDAEIRLRLEGNNALFPVKAVDFTKDPKRPHDALYMLEKKYSALDSNFHSAYTLYFNTNHPLFKLINADTEEKPEVQYIIRLIMADVYRTLVEDALDPVSGLPALDKMLLSNEQEHYTLAAVYTNIIADLLRLYFPQKDFTYLQNLAKGSYEQRNQIITAVQAYILGDIK